MPDYGAGSSGKGKSLKNKYGSGNKAKQAASRNAARRKKRALKKAQERAAKALADQKKINAQNANKKAAQSLLGAGQRNVQGKQNRSTLGEKLMSGIRNLRYAMGPTRGKKDRSGMTAKEKFDDNDARKAFLRSKERKQKRKAREEQNKPPVDPTPTPTPEQPDGGLPSIPRKPEVTPEMRRAALEIFESQQGAGQVPYYMAAARNAQNPNMSPAFQYAAQNYDILGGSQRLAPRPMEMMSVAERQQINRMAEGMAQPPQRDYRTMPITFPENRMPGHGGQGTPPTPRPQFPTGLGPRPMPHQLPTGLGDRIPPSPQQDYQQGMDMVMRGGGKGGAATGQQAMPPQGLAALLAQRFGGFGGQ